MWRRIVTRGFVILIGLALVAQVVRIDKTNPPVSGDVGAPAPVARVLRNACYDCHSNEVRWPWYADVAPVSWLLARDVKEGREELNFSAWTQYDGKKRIKKLKETIEEVGDHEMPPWYYAMMHPEARLAEDERLLLLDWARGGLPGTGAASNAAGIVRDD